MPMPMLPLWSRVMAPAAQIPQPAHVSASDGSRDGRSRGRWPPPSRTNSASSWSAGQTACQVPAARVDAGYRWDDRRTGGSIIPNSEKGFSIAGTLPAQGERTPISAEHWDSQRDRTGIRPMVRRISDVVARGAGRVSRFLSTRRVPCRAWPVCPSPRGGDQSG